MYNPSESTTENHDNGPNSAGWFDAAAVDKINGYGRSRLQGKNDPKRFLDSSYGLSWRERSVNASIACKRAGCSANATVAVFATNNEEARSCKLDVHLHPTDLDSNWSKEMILPWQVNGYRIEGKCEMIRSGCHYGNAFRPLFPCLRDVPIDRIIRRTGSITIQGSISRLVDECPYHGNLLSGMIAVTCMVRQTTTTTTTTLAIQKISNFSVGAALQCSTPGCSAEALIRISPRVAFLVKACFLDVTLNQTDFAGTAEEPEIVEYVSVDGADLSANVTPGKNPCQSGSPGLASWPEQRTFSLLKSVNVTQQLRAHNPAGSLRIGVKISEYVDECPTPAGFLLDGWVTLHCSPPS